MSVPGRGSVVQRTENRFGGRGGGSGREGAEKSKHRSHTWRRTLRC